MKPKYLYKQIILTILWELIFLRDSKKEVYGPEERKYRRWENIERGKGLTSTHSTFAFEKDIYENMTDEDLESRESFNKKFNKRYLEELKKIKKEEYFKGHNVINEAIKNKNFIHIEGITTNI